MLFCVPLLAGTISNRGKVLVFLHTANCTLRYQYPHQHIASFFSSSHVGSQKVLDRSEAHHQRCPRSACVSSNSSGVQKCFGVHWEHQEGWRGCRNRENCATTRHVLSNLHQLYMCAAYTTHFDSSKQSLSKLSSKTCRLEAIL